jgi:hypothetical protein
MSLLRRARCGLLGGHAWHVVTEVLQCMRCGHLSLGGQRLQPAEPVTHELRVTFIGRKERLSPEEKARLGRLLRRPHGQTQRVFFSTSPSGSIELTAAGYPGLLGPSLADEVAKVLGPFEQAIVSARARNG